MSPILSWLLVNAGLLGWFHNGQEGRGVRGQDLPDWRSLRGQWGWWPCLRRGNVEQPRGMAVGIANDAMPMMVMLQLSWNFLGFPRLHHQAVLLLLLLLEDFLLVTQLLLLELVLPNEAISFVKVPDEGVVAGVILVILVVLVVLVILVVLQRFRRG